MDNKVFGFFSLKGKIVVVTGGTQKHGYRFCKTLAEAGGTVMYVF